MNKEYRFIYQHNNGALVFESEDGGKYIKYDDLPFDSIADVNEYIKKSGVRLKRADIMKKSGIILDDK